MVNWNLTGGGRETRLMFSKQKVRNYSKSKKVTVEFHTSVGMWKLIMHSDARRSMAQQKCETKFVR